MENQPYRKQASLLLNVLPVVARETCFALYGGTAINLFIRDMPRLSVDIDLTYVPIEDRRTSLQNISKALEKIKWQLEATIPHVRVIHLQDVSKLQIASEGVQIKLEVSQTARGIIAPLRKLPLCEKAQVEFDAFCTMPIVPLGQLFGGKICAALDRQHPRDLFDIKYLLAHEGFSEDIKTGFLFYLLSSDRPINELLHPNLHDQRSTLRNHFDGMSMEPFSYEDYETARQALVSTIQSGLTAEDKDFLLAFKNTTPDWKLYDFARFPAVQWKLQNLQKLKSSNPAKHQALYDILKAKLEN